MRRLFLISLIFLVGCKTSVVEPPVFEIPEHNLVVIYDGEYIEFEVYEDGYRCWHTNAVVTPVLVLEEKAYYLLTDEVYCLSWVDVRKPLFHWIYNGEPVSGRIYSAKIIDSPDDLRSYDIR